MNYCRDFSETPKSVSSLFEIFKKMKVVKKRRADGMWYYMERKATEENKVVEVENVVVDIDLPF